MKVHIVKINKCRMSKRKWRKNDHLYGIYGTSENDSRTTKDEFWETPQEEREQVCRKIMIVGDLNGELGKQVI